MRFAILLAVLLAGVSGLVAAERPGRSTSARGGSCSSTTP